jgi:hypothetical protein
MVQPAQDTKSKTWDLRKTACPHSAQTWQLGLQKNNTKEWAMLPHLSFDYPNKKRFFNTGRSLCKAKKMASLQVVWRPE